MPIIKYKVGEEFLTIPIVSEETPFPIYNGLDKEETGWALDASQGKILEEKKFDKDRVYNDVNMQEEGYALDARQGKLIYDRTGGAHTGVDLTTLFKTASDFQIAVSQGDFSNICIGDYWPITLNGTYYDYAGRKNITLTDAVVEMEVVAIDPYLYYGDSGDLATGTHHVVMISRDLLPNAVQYCRSATAWHSSSASCPWLGSAMYATLNTQSNGLVNLVTATDLGGYIYTGNSNGGMRHYVEKLKSSEMTTEEGQWINRGILWLPTEVEIFGKSIMGFWTDQQYEDTVYTDFDPWATSIMESSGIQFRAFNESSKYRVKRLGKGGAVNRWWTASCSYPFYSVLIGPTGVPAEDDINVTAGFPLCFIVA